MVVVCDNRKLSQTIIDPPNPPEADSSTFRPPIEEASEALPAYTPNPSPHSFTPIDPILLISVIFSMALCIATLILSLFDGGRASAFLNLLCPILILFHHTLLFMDEVKLDHTRYFMGRDKFFSGRGDLSRWLFFDSLSSTAGSIIAFTNVRWWGGTVPAQAIVQFIQILTLWYIVWRAFAMRNPTQGIPIILPNGSTVMIRFSKPSWAPLLSESLPLPLWAMIPSVELAVVLFILAVTDDPHSPRHTVNILSSISIIFHHVLVVLIYLDKRTSESEAASNVDREPLLPFLRHVVHGESSDPRAGLLTVVSLFQLIASCIAGAVMASKEASRSGNALTQTVVQIVECVLLGALALTALAKLFVSWQQQNADSQSSIVRERIASQNPV